MISLIYEISTFIHQLDVSTHLKRDENETRSRKAPSKGGKFEKIEDVNGELSFPSKVVNRRQAISKIGSAAIGAGVAVLAAGGAAAYFARRPPEIVSTTSTNTLTNTLTSTLLSTVTAERDYYYDPSLSGTKITLLAAVCPETPYEQAVAGLFTLETGIQVNFIVQPEPVVEAKASTAYAAHSTDYDMVDGGAFGALALPWMIAGYLEPFNSYIDKTPSAWKYDDILPVVIPYMSWKDELYAFPCAGGMVDYPYMYRKDLIPQPAKTIDEMISYAKTNNKPPSIYGYTTGGTPDVFSFCSFDMYLWAEGKDYLDKDYHPNLNTPEGIDAIKNFVEISKYAPAFPTTNADDAASNFAQGRAAQLTDFWTWYKITKGSSPVADKVSYAPHPKVVSEPHMLASESISISKGSDQKHKDAAWSFVSFLMSPRMAEVMFGQGYGSTMRKSVLNNAVDKQQHPDDIDVMNSILQANPDPNSGAPVVAGAVFPHIPRSPDFLEIVVQMLSDAVAGKASPTDAANAGQDKATALMKEVGLYK